MKLVPKLVVFAPHPDDEVIACGGTILKRISEGFDVRIVFLTDGSQSHAAVLGIETEPTPEELIQIRKQEAKEAAELMGVASKNLYFLGAQDTKLAESETIVRDRIRTFLLEVGMIDEIYIPHLLELHRDHCVTNSIVTSIIRELEINTKVFQYVVWNESTERDIGFSLRDNRPASKGMKSSFGRRVEVDVSGFVRKKLEALKAHRSQLELISPHQHRAIIPESFLERLTIINKEVFFLMK